MALSKLSVGKGIEVAFDDRRSELLSEAKVLLMRDGKDLEVKMKERQKSHDGLTFTLSRTPLGDIEVTATVVKLRVPIRG